MLLIAGGARDPNLQALVARATEHGIALRTVLVGENATPALSWDLAEDRLTLDGEDIRPSAVFIRYDVFEELHDPREQVSRRAVSWHAAVMSWALAHSDVRMFNTAASASRILKPIALLRATKCGLQCPVSIVSNETDKISAVEVALIAKPTAGGSYCEAGPAALEGCEPRDGRAAAPAIVQERVYGPDVRIYRIGGAFLTYRISSDALDYRTDDQSKVDPLEPGIVSTDTFASLWQLTEDLGLDFCAADFKLCERTGITFFLEVNNAPMFAAFDSCDEGAVCDAIIGALMPTNANIGSNRDRGRFCVAHA